MPPSSPTRAYPTEPAVGVLAVVWRRNRVLLVRRANPPQAGQWGFPGGRMRLGETLGAAALRELREETGVEARAVGAFAALDLIDRGPGRRVRHHYVLVAVLARWRAGEPRAQGDAMEAAWFRMDALPAPLCADVDEVVRKSHALIRASSHCG